jgi:hypothetical protein
MLIRSARPSQSPVAVTGPVQALPHINVSGVDARGPLATVQQAVAGAALVGSLAGLHRFLLDMQRCRPITEAMTESTLDLIGPSTGTGLLQLGSSVIDSSVASVLDLFERIGEDHLLQRLGIRELRLIGSRTAVEPAGQDAMRKLAQLLGVTVRGTTGLVYRDHFREHGYDWDLDQLLADDRSLPPRTGSGLWSEDTTAVRAREFAFDRITIVRESALPPVRWPRFLIPRGFDIKSLASQIRTGEGRCLPGLLALPRCELLIPAGRLLDENRYRIVEVLFNWEAVRILGSDQPDGAVYPIISPARSVRQFIGLPQYQP